MLAVKKTCCMNFAIEEMAFEGLKANENSVQRFHKHLFFLSLWNKACLQF